LYVAGDWAGHGEMLADAAIASAKRAAQAILQAKV
jgi:pyruvate/2-oxoglutarate dehydrogenase complex dihydrolipoamide dehydrogenase (E3) component